MQLVTDADGHPAPRLNDVALSEKQALAFHAGLLNEVVRMLCAGMIHGDLSEYNILVGSEYGKEIWKLYQAGTLTIESKLTGRIEADHHIADVAAVLEEVKLAIQEEERRQMYRALAQES